MENKVKMLLDCLKKKQQIEYDIYTTFEEFKNYVALGKTSKERLQILIMCYVDNPTIEELNNWTLEDLLEYIKETDVEFYGQDMIEIRKCIKLIKECE